MESEGFEPSACGRAKAALFQLSNTAAPEPAAGVEPASLTRTRGALFHLSYAGKRDGPDSNRRPPA
jgi:hypothetical protein